jgi:DNA-binding NtrC family response regulator
LEGAPRRDTVAKEIETMDPKKILYGRRLLIVDDEPDVLQTLIETLDMCKIDTATTFEEAKRLLETGGYECAVLDIMGVDGFALLEIANEKGVPALMLTAHALTEESLKKSAERGAAYFAPKDLMHDIDLFLADVVEAHEKMKNPWVKWLERLGSFYDRRFVGTNWREKEQEFWQNKLKSY